MLRTDIEKSDSEQEKVLIKKSPSHSKWEKADILEMSVAYIKQLRRRVATHNKMKQSLSLPYFVDGFSDCVREIQNYTTLHNWPADFREYNNRLTNHLTARLRLLISELNMKEAKSNTEFILKCLEDQSQIYENSRATEKLRPKGHSPSSAMQVYRMSVESLPWDCTVTSDVHYNNPACSNHQQTSVIQPSTSRIANHRASVGCMTDTSHIPAQFEVNLGTDHCGKASLLRDNTSSSNHCNADREYPKTNCCGYRLWRPF
uniref:BHLH domain-containing protein n=1 Tax=Setaria digitata TaxID=48799 RepID=A0A915Q510_9BILA